MMVLKGTEIDFLKVLIAVNEHVSFLDLLKLQRGLRKPHVAWPAMRCQAMSLCLSTVFEAMMSSRPRWWWMNQALLHTVFV